MRNYHNLFNQMIDRIMSYNGHIYFITLTMKNDDVLNKYTIANFFKKVDYRGVHINGYFWVKELQKRGVVHYHIILLVSEKTRDFYSIVNESWRHGFVFVRGVEKTKIKNVIFYIMKYVKKELGMKFENEKMKRRIGRGGILRFRVVPFFERVANFSEFEYVGCLGFPGFRVKFYRYRFYVLMIVNGVRSRGIHIFEVNREIIEKMRYEFKNISSVTEMINSVSYQILTNEEIRDIYEYHKFCRDLDSVIFS